MKNPRKTMKNPPAFPRRLGHYYDTVSGKMKDMGDEQGMTLRDYFAAAALAGILANPETNDEGSLVIRAAFQAADEMLDEREKQK